MDNDNDPSAPAAAAAAAAAPPSAVRQTISISLSKKPKKKASSAKLQLSTAEEEYSTIAEHAEALSKKRAEEGQVLVIPCQQTRDEGKPLLAQRSHARDVSNEEATAVDAQKVDDDEATRQLIESATHRQDDETKQSSGLTIAAPQQNTLNTKATKSSTATDDELFRRDLSHRAEDVDPNSSTYANISISDFGGALLRGMGWTGGDTKKKEQEIRARPHRLGLGATPMLPPPTGKHGRARRPEELKKEEEMMKAEKEREKKRLEMERLDVQYTLQNGSVVKIDGGRAKVIQTAGVPGLNRILVKLENGQEEAVNKGSVRLCSWEQLEKDPFQEKRERREERRNDSRYHQKSKDDLSNGAKNNGHGRDDFNGDHRDNIRHKESSRDGSDDDGHHDRKRRKVSRHEKYDSSDEDSRHERKKKESRHSRKRDRSEGNRSPRSQKHHDRDDKKRHKYDSRSSRHEHINWLLPNIRIRLVSKKYSRQHLQKGIVQDVISSQNNNPKAVILMDNQEVLDNVPERYLETALPKTGGNVIVLEGVHRWKKGRLLERSSAKGTGVIQLFEDLEVVEVSLDGVAEWCGPLDEDME
ncbi:hypothetical protein ACHAWO_007160 [Cyclotella atomus]|uniref:Spp2/MOS2 G-patch domain-containing protein n=1 Tax=Cyclotella atomus TaxID=382360 RepID=A0ABD3QYB7_9STRA